MIKLMLLQLFEFAENLSSNSRLQKIILTLGKDGVLILENGSTTHYKAGEVNQSEIRSVVGAGDCFLAGYVYGLVNGQSEADCVRCG